MGAIGMAIDRDTMIVFTTNPSALMSVVSLDTDSTLLEFGMPGRGPGEYITLTTACQFEDRNGHICLWTHNTDLFSMLVDITESVKQQRLVRVETVELGAMYRQRRGLMILPDGNRFVKFAVLRHDARDNVFDGPRYVYFSPENKEVKELEFFNLKPFSIADPNGPNAARVAFEGTIKITKDGTRAVDAYNFADHINFLDLTNNKGFSVSYSQGLSVDDLFNTPVERLMNKIMFTYKDVAVTDTHVFALYSGKLDLPAPQIAPAINSSIRIFDWDGNPLALVNLDRELSDIAYNQRTKRIYGLDPEENIVYYELEDVI